ncbi:hypothetical protein RhiirA4_485748 [Rhizophagus irregularis]|uniref:Uncharacterized protein n=1 Tax=Rhizophagus irregularis TaxID=588596 RepID=A0A2I1HQI4_9GLOM|nr:hypothetical protein RhiirA4_485748 [Rhizophagus irregularis]
MAMRAMVQELGNQIAQENLNRPLTYEQLMNRHRDQLTKLNISLCRECFIPIGKEEGEHCNEVRKHYLVRLRGLQPKRHAKARKHISISDE